MTKLASLIETYTPEQRTAALEVLDLCTRPLQVREIEGLLRLSGVSRSRSIKLASSLKRVAIVAVMPEDADG